MRKSILVSAAAALLTLAGTTNASAGIFRPGSTRTSSPSGFSSLAKNAGEYISKAVDENGVMTPDNVFEGKYTADLEPVGSLLSPTGEHWFYNLEFEGEEMEGSNQYYTKWNYTGFKLTVYNGKCEPVGYVRGKANFPEGAMRCNRVNVATQVTSKFFDSNSSTYEVVVDFNYNPDEKKYYYGAKQYSQAYTLQSEMPAEAQTPLFECPGLLQGVVDGSTATSESFLLSFVYESTWTNEPAESGKVTLRVYKPVSWGKTTPELIAQQTSYVSDGDGINDAIPFFVAVHGSDVYSVRSYYEKPLFDYSSGDNPTLTADNHFVVELYKPSSSNPIITDYTDPDANPGKPWKKVSIPVEAPTEGDFIWRSYAIGNFLGDRDVTWDFSTGNDPCLIISIVDSNVQEDTQGYYRVYDLEGNIVKEFGTASNYYVLYPSLEGQSEQIGFNCLNKDGDTVTQLVDWPSLEVKGEVPALFEYEGNIYTLSSIPSRIVGEGGALYSANVTPAMGDGESSLAYIAYLRADGSLHHMDKLSLPENTAKAYAFTEADVLDPYLFNTDSKYEYLIWLYTWKDNNKVGTDLSLCVVDNEGKIIARRNLPNNHSNENAYVSNCPDQRFIVLNWRDASKLSNPSMMEFVSLPLNNFEGEGTVENPYLIYTYGDFDRMRNNLTSHFALAGDIDMENRAFRMIEGTFLGSLDGRGHTVKNLYLSLNARGALFDKFGQRPEEETTEPSAVMKNITFSGVSMLSQGSIYGTRSHAMLAAEARYSEFNNVMVVNPILKFTENVNMNFGVFANVADNVTFTDCGVKGADIEILRGNGVAGIAQDARACQFRNVYVNGSFKGRVNVAGVAANTNSYSSSIDNAHVVADLEASNDCAGGVVASNNSRTSVRNSIVEGTITATSSVGGIAGSLSPTDEPEAEDLFLIENNVVNLSAINAGDTPEAVHRIVGYTTIDDGEQTRWVENPEWDPSDPNSPSGSYVTIPATPEAHIGVNHVISDLPAFDTTEGLATEGTTTSLYDNEDLFYDLGFKFGTSTDAPWSAPTWINRVPKLYFESTIGQSMKFDSSAYTGEVESIIKVKVTFEGIDPFEAIGSGFVSMNSSDESVAYFNGMMDLEEGTENVVVFEVQLGQEGTARLSLSYNGLTTAATVTVSHASGIADVEIDGTETPVYYNLQGVRVAEPEHGVFIEVRGNKAVKVIK